MTTQIQSGDVQINKFKITNLNGTSYNLYGQLSALTITEDIFNPCLVCEVVINDAIGLLTSLPIVGGEKIEINFQTPGKDPYICEMYVVSVNNIYPNENNTSMVYIIKAVSEEILFGTTPNLEKSYNTTIDKIIEDILTNILNTKKKLYLDPTKGIQKINFNRKSPFDAIDWLRTKAQSAINKSSSYVFFENKYGFNFNTIENLMAKNQDKSIDKVITKYISTATEFQSPKLADQLVQFGIGQHFNILDLMKLGSLNNKHQTFDLITKKLTNYDFKLPDFGRFSGTEKKKISIPITDDVYTKYCKDNSSYTFSLVDSSRSDSYIGDIISNKIGFSGIQFNRTTDILINGDTSVSCGNMIKINIPKIDGLDKKQESQEPFINGNYFISRIQHKIKFGPASGPEYSQLLQIIKGTYTL